MGPLRFIGCRTSERNIKKYTNLIKSVVKPGVNASNILVNEQSLQSYGLQQIISSIDRNSNPRYTVESFLLIQVILKTKLSFGSLECFIKLLILVEFVLVLQMLVCFARWCLIIEDCLIIALWCLSILVSRSQNDCSFVMLESGRYLILDSLK